MKRTVYADNSATTRITEPVLDAMMPYLTECYGNASSIYSLGNKSERAIIEAREKVAKALGANTSEIYFTSGGTEADNWALKGVAHKLSAKGKKHIITTVFEHHAILHTCDALKKEGFDITLIPVSNEGLVNPDDIKNAIREDTAIVSVMYANNEIGTIEPIAEIGAICKEKGVLFHTDAVQAIGNVEIDVKAQNIDLLSLSAHKIHGPKGVGALYIRNGILIPNLIDGGAQERTKRAGTENVAGIVGLGVAIELACADITAKTKKLAEMRDYVMEKLLAIPHSRLNGHREKRMAGNVNISFEGIEGESLLLMLDANGISASSGSACTTASLDPSHVLLSIGLPHEIAHGSLRISFGDENTMEDAKYICEVVPMVVEKIRSFSPLWEKIIANEK